MRVLCWAVFLLLGLSSVAHAGDWGESWGSMLWGAVAAAVPSLGWGGGALLVLLLVGLALWRRPGPSGAALVLLFALGDGLVAEAQTVTVPHTFTNGQPADADEVNENFDALESAATETNARVTELGSAVTTGVVDASEIRIGGTTVIDSSGTVVGVPASDQSCPPNQIGTGFNAQGVILCVPLTDLLETGAMGPAGEDGSNSLVVTTVETSGANCANGGLKFDIGVDDDGSNSLQPSEIDMTRYVCNGALGAQGTQGPAGTPFGFRYELGTPSSFPYPATQSILFDDGTYQNPSLVSLGFIDHHGNDHTPYVQSLSNYGSSSERGTIVIREEGDPTNGAYFKLGPVSYGLASEGILFNVVADSFTPFGTGLVTGSFYYASFFPSGATGAAGPAGAAGAAGAKGDPGVAGPQGVAGAAGPAGAAGAAGAKGDPGVAGAQGVAGAAGAKGDPGVAGAAGAKGDPGVAGPAGPAGADAIQGVLDFAGLDSTLAKSALASGTSQGFGEIEIYTLSGTPVLAGQPLCLNVSEVGPVSCAACSPSADAVSFLGISTANATSGDSVQVLTQGYVTARLAPLPPLPAVWVRDEAPMPEIHMGVADGTYGAPGVQDGRIVNLNGTIRFTDDGGEATDYSNAALWHLDFDAGAGETVGLKINSFRFESASFVEFDHLGIEYSVDGATWNTLSAAVAPTLSSGLYSTPTSAWKSANVTIGPSYFGGGGDGGWIFPGDSADSGSVTYPDGFIGEWHEIDARYVRFWFRSDATTTREGWSIELASLEYVPGAEVVTLPVGNSLHLDPTDATRLSDGGAGYRVGYAAGTDAGDDAVFVRMKPGP